MSLAKPMIFNFSLLSTIRRYKGSRVQEGYHDYGDSDRRAQNIRKTLDYDFINRESTGRVYIREYLFQERRIDYKINFPFLDLQPKFKWGVQLTEGMKIRIENLIDEDNYQIGENYETQFAGKLKKYYDRVGKKKYAFAVPEEIKKISDMTDEEFEDFIRKIQQK